MPKRNLAWLAVIALIAAAFWKLPTTAARFDRLDKAFGPLMDVRKEIERYYVDPELASDQALVTGAIKGMLRELDPYSVYLPPTEAAEFDKHAKGEFAGVGIEIGDDMAGVHVVLSPMEDTPAFHAGVLAGDRILAVDGVPTEGKSLADTMRAITGEPGSTVVLTLLHPAHAEPRDVPIRRELISIPSLAGWMRQAGGAWDYFVDPAERLAYVRLTGFVDATRPDLERTVRALLDDGMRGLVIDLRFNGGGLLSSAVAIADLFLDRGVIVSTKRLTTDGPARDLSAWRASPEGTLPDFPLVILVNRLSASASEIVAGALRDHQRAVIVGERTFGKGSVQNVFHLSSPLDGASVKLTIAYYYLPKGELIHRTKENTATGNWGVAPSVEIVLTGEESIRFQRSRLEAGVIRAPTTRAAGTPATRPGPDTRPVTPPIDRQLAKALEELRARLAPKPPLAETQPGLESALP